MDDADRYDKMVVIENGSSFIKAGLGCDESPRVYMGFNNNHIVRYHLNIPGQQERVENELVFVQQYPVEYGQVVDWESMEKYWSEIFSNGLGVTSDGSEVVIVESIGTSFSERRKTMEIMFKKLNISRLCLLNQAVTTFTHVGEVSGVLVDVGHDKTTVIPVINREAVGDSSFQMHYAGKYMIQNIRDTLSKRHPELCMRKSPVEMWDAACDVKENCCYVSQDYDKELAEIQNKENNRYKTFSGECITLGDELIKTPEFLFCPKVDGISLASLQQSVDNCIRLVPDLKRTEFTKSKVILAGGSTLFQGFENRFKQELRRISGAYRVIACPDRLHASWKGAMKLIKVIEDYPEDDENRGIDDVWISKQEFEDFGAAVLYDKQYPRYLY